MVMESNGHIAVLGRLLHKSFRSFPCLLDSEIEDLEGLMRSLDGLHLSPSVPDARFWPLSSSGLFSVKSFFLALSQFSGSPQVFPSKFICKSQVPFKVKSFVWLVAHKKGVVLWQAASITLIRVVWWERNARIFEDKTRNSEYLWDSIVFLASLWAFYSKVFKGTPLNVLQLDCSEAYNNTDLAGSIVDCISTSGYYIIPGGNLVICKSKKQDAVARSNVEVDFRAMAQGIYEPLLLENIIGDLVK
ncbi:hypothetical protein CK203_095166 [Vitis vinifera]|uniref:Reverse transcriptase zinc-binding domain-containing protein n=1 Tax=Vitis vinifera TaxID=29760 RepID=A0A438C7C4_VITVI|nr:hypothetical protein CK203_095166 [Vitis vinifera]